MIPQQWEERSEWCKIVLDKEGEAEEEKRTSQITAQREKRSGWDEEHSMKTSLGIVKANSDSANTAIESDCQK